MLLVHGRRTMCEVRSKGSDRQTMGRCVAPLAKFRTSRACSCIAVQLESVLLRRASSRFVSHNCSDVDMGAGRECASYCR